MSLYRTVIIVLVLGATAWVSQVASRSEIIQPNRPFDQFPLEPGVWKGIRGSLDAQVYNVLGVEDYILANYINPAGKVVNLYVGFYQSQKEGDLIHSPKNCMPGAGWNIIDTSQEPVMFQKDAPPAKVIRLVLQKGSARQVVLYWFQSRGRIIASEYMQKIWLVIDSITRQRTDGAFVRLMAPVVRNEAETTGLLKEFAKTIKPHLDAHIPS